ncbi:hypothetical protein C8Q75DRAFT_802540 [Abortiporus biennis]|nr:hypothetical protein C8Q75DRAFT_802540 [Abortiporus biennis]
MFHSNGTSRPKITSWEDVEYGGEDMIQLNVSNSTVAGLLIFVVHGRQPLTSQCISGMMVVAGRVGIPAPSVVWSSADRSEEELGGHVLIMVKEHGESLHTLWPKMTHNQRKVVCKKLSEIMFKMFHTRTNRICTARACLNIDEMKGNVLFDKLLHPSFEDINLTSYAAPNAIPTSEEYLNALSHRIDNIFAARPGCKHLGYPGKPTLTPQDIFETRETWKRMEKLIPYHSGGWYLPNTFSPEATTHALEILQSDKTALFHELNMHNIIIDLRGKGSKDEDMKLCIATGWDRAYFAPLWSCARMPEWISSTTPGIKLAFDGVSVRSKAQLSVTSPSDDERGKLWRGVYHHMKKNSPEWVIAFVFGEEERFFEGCLRSHWMFRDAVEVGLRLLEEKWKGVRPRVPFPIELPQLQTTTTRAHSNVAEKTKVGEEQGAGSGSSVSTEAVTKSLQSTGKEKETRKGKGKEKATESEVVESVETLLEEALSTPLTTTFSFNHQTSSRSPHSPLPQTLTTNSLSLTSPTRHPTPHSVNPRSSSLPTTSTPPVSLPPSSIPDPSLAITTTEESSIDSDTLSSSSSESEYIESDDTISDSSHSYTVPIPEIPADTIIIKPESLSKPNPTIVEMVRGLKALKNKIGVFTSGVGRKSSIGSLTEGFMGVTGSLTMGRR